MYLWAPVWDCESSGFFLEWQIEEKATVCTENLCAASSWGENTSSWSIYWKFIEGKGFKSERKGRKERKMKQIVLETAEVKNCKAWFLPLPMPGIPLHPWDASDSNWQRESWRDREGNICGQVFRIYWIRWYLYMHYQGTDIQSSYILVVLLPIYNLQFPRIMSSSCATSVIILWDVWPEEFGCLR